MQRQIMRQMQKKFKQSFSQMQEKIQEELSSEIVEGVAGGGVVKIQMNGNQEVLSVKIDPSVVNPEEVEMLEDLILVAIKDAMGKLQQVSMEKLSKLTGGLNIPGLF